MRRSVTALQHTLEFGFRPDGWGGVVRASVSVLFLNSDRSPTPLFHLISQGLFILFVILLGCWEHVRKGTTRVRRALVKVSLHTGPVHVHGGQSVSGSEVTADANVCAFLPIFVGVHTVLLSRLARAHDVVKVHLNLENMMMVSFPLIRQRPRMHSCLAPAPYLLLYLTSFENR